MAAGAVRALAHGDPHRSSPPAGRFDDLASRACASSSLDTRDGRTCAHCRYDSGHTARAPMERCDNATAARLDRGRRARSPGRDRRLAATSPPQSRRRTARGPEVSNRGQRGAAARVSPARTVGGGLPARHVDGSPRDADHRALSPVPAPHRAMWCSAAANRRRSSSHVGHLQELGDLRLERR